MEDRIYDVICIGIQCIDIIPTGVAGDIFSKDVNHAREIKLMLGGDALNQAINLSRMGANVALMGAVGNDDFGDTLIKKASEDIPEVLSKRVNTNTAVSIVLKDADNERHFVYTSGSTGEFCREHIDAELFKQAKFVSIGSCCTLPKLDGADMYALLCDIRAAGAQSCIDFSMQDEDFDVYWMQKIISAADYVLPSEYEAALLAGGKYSPENMAAKLKALGAKNCIIKLGKNGCYVDADGIKGRFAAPAADAVDTTGAGDAFVAGFLFGKINGWDIERCVRFALAAGSVAVESQGANTAIKSERQVLERMERAARG